jgi:hypothetical protein
MICDEYEIFQRMVEYMYKNNIELLVEMLQENYNTNDETIFVIRMEMEKECEEELKSKAEDEAYVRYKERQ